MQAQLVELPIAWPLVLGVGLAAIVLLYALAVLVRMFRQRRGQAVPAWRPERIEVARLAQEGPPEEGPRLEVYGTPVRLALVVLAPVGRQGSLPEASQIPALIDEVVPGLREIFERDKPRVELWPEQLSSLGFTQSFYGSVVLPGDRGKGTPWCSIAGKFPSRSQHYLVGFACCAARDNALSQHTVEHEGQWLDILRVRSGS